MTSVVRTTFLCTALAAAVLSVAGCGGDGDAPTRAQFIAKTDELCEASTRRTLTLNLQLRRAAAGAQDDRDLLRRLAPILERGYERVRENAAAFRAFEPPEDGAADIARVRRLYDQQAQFVRRLAAAARGRDVSRFKSLTEAQQNVVTQARRLSRAYGFRECGSTSSDPT